jgi:Sulfotransferase family
MQRGVEARRAHFCREVIERFAPHGRRGISPIFVEGMPRSGTSLVEQILSSHSQVVGIGEGVELFRATEQVPALLSSQQAYPQCLEELSTEGVRRLADPLAKAFQNLAGPGERVVTKMPEDFWDLGLIAMLLPEARIIHCTRHPIDTCLSCYMQNFVRLAYATSLDNLAAVYRLYRQIMEHWRGLLPTSTSCDISYEELVGRPEETIRRLCGFCGLKFEENCLRFHENPRRVDTASRWQVRRPLYAASIGRWEHYREFLGPLLSLAEPTTSSPG